MMIAVFGGVGWGVESVNRMEGHRLTALITFLIGRIVIWDEPVHCPSMISWHDIKDLMPLQLCQSVSEST